ncbi:MAG: ABC transporter permease [Microbacterium enclense]
MLEASTATTTATLATPPRRNAVWARLRRNPEFWIGAVLVGFFLLITAWPSLISGLFGHGDPRACDLSDSRGAPDLAAGHPFGFTIQGCDLYASVVHGAANSIIVGITVTLGTLVIAIALGLLAGYYGGWIDTVLSRVSEIVVSVPLLLGAVLVLNSVQTRNVWLVSAVLIAFSWPTAMRVMRTSTISVRSRSFITAARSLGLRDWRIMLTHVAPNTVGPVIVLATLQVGAVIASEATLTYLGIGLQAPALSWGLQLSQAEPYFASAPHLLYAPAAALTLAVAGFILLGEAIRQAGFHSTNSA